MAKSQYEVIGRVVYLGHAHVLELTVDAEQNQTRGKYRITEL